MLNPVNNAVQEIMYEIPEPILKHVFGFDRHHEWRREAPVSIDEMIKVKVIRPRVLKDCNLIGGREVVISLEGLQAYQPNTYTSIYDIPLERTAGRSITGILSVSYLPDSTSMGTMGALYAGVNPISMSDAATAAQRVMDSFSNVPHISTAEAEIIGYNTVLIKDQYRPTITYGLRCQMSNDENLSNLQPKSYKAFAHACMLAVKAYVYVNTVVQMDRGRLEQGQDLGVFKQIIDEYKECNAEYHDYLRNVLQKVLFMNDTTTYGRFITLQMNPAL